MRKKIFQSILAFSLVGLIILVGGYFFNQTKNIPSAQAGASDNVSGFAWSENIGWISFNNISDGSTQNYGVNIDSTTGTISGYAWSENIGWIDLAPIGPYPDTPNYPSKADITTLGIANSTVTGWARAVAHGGGWDGWIKFTNTYIDPSGDWHGWAWGGDVIGWISFNSSDPNATGGSSYEVIYQVPHTLTISCDSTTLDVGTTTQCHAIYDSTTDVTASATWLSSDINVATINASGLVTATSSGSTNISASFSGITASPITITVNAPTHSKWYEIIPW